MKNQSLKIEIKFKKIKVEKPEYSVWFQLFELLEVSTLLDLERKNEKPTKSF